jgi:serine/threonine protein kinase
VCGVQKIHEEKLIHRDLKTDNILMHKPPKTTQMILKISDFGFMRLFSPNKMTSMRGFNLKFLLFLSFFFFRTPYYAAPEILEGKTQYTEKVDIWSVGAIYYYLLVGKFIFLFYFHFFFLDFHFLQNLLANCKGYINKIVNIYNNIK